MVADETIAHPLDVINFSSNKLTLNVERFVEVQIILKINELAYALDEVGDFSGARNCLLEVIELCRKYDPTSQGAIYAMKNLAVFYRKHERSEEARKIYKQVEKEQNTLLAEKFAKFGEDSLEVAGYRKEVLSPENPDNVEKIFAEKIEKEFAEEKSDKAPADDS